MAYGFLGTEILSNSSVYYQPAAELGLLGCVFLKGNAEVLEGVSDEDFHNEEARQVAKALRQLKDKIDLALLNKKLGELYPERAGRLMQYAIEAEDKAVSLVMLKEYKKIVQECAGRRRLYLSLKQGMEDIGKPELEMDVVLDGLLQQLKYCSTEQASWMSSYDIMLKTMNHLEKVGKGEIKPIQSDLTGLDQAIGGFYDGELTILGARPAVGKSAFANFIAIRAAMQGKKVCVCSREMSDVQYGQRLISTVGKVEGRKLRLGIPDEEQNTWIAVGDAVNKISNLPIHFLFHISHIEDLRAEVRRKALQGECDLLIVDYLQLLRTKKQFAADHLRVGYISKMLKDMTLDLNIPILALAQVKRGVAGQKVKMPSLDDLKDSGSIEQDADGVIFLHRPQDASDPYIRQKDKAVFERVQKEQGLQYICVNVAKQRQGETGALGLVFNPNKMAYIEAEKLRGYNND